MSAYEANIWVVGGGQDPATTVAAVNNAIGEEFVALVGQERIFLTSTGDLLVNEQTILVVTGADERTAYVCDSITITH